MVKFSHSIFALPFAVLAMFLAAQPKLPTAGQATLIIVCMVAARSAAMTFNRIVDAPYDATNPRTASRPLITGAISRRGAWGFFLIACAAFVVGCAGFWVLHENAWPLRLALPVLAYLCFYSYTKRFTRWSH
ncbi:MAG: 4-hydroxybenzoate octaprenyltransferase, partial [Planctomycetota bacterium]